MNEIGERAVELRSGDQEAEDELVILAKASEATEGGFTGATNDGGAGWKTAP